MTIGRVDEIVSWLAAAAAFGSGITAGLLFCVAFTVVPVFARMPASDYLELHRDLGRNVDRVMPAVVLGSTLLDVVSAVLADRGTVLFVAGAVSLFGVSVVSHLGNVPINRRVRGMAGGPVPAGWDDPRPRWRQLNLLRTAFSFVALALNCAVIVAVG